MRRSWIINSSVWIVLGGMLLCSTIRAQELPFTHYTTDGDRALPSAAVNKVYQDRLGYVWIVIFSSGLVRYDGTTMETYTTNDGLRDLEVWGVLEDPFGRLWVASNAGLSVSEEPLEAYDAGRRIRFTPRLGSTPLLNQRVWTNNVAAGPDGSLWAGTSGDGVVRYRIRDAVIANIDTLATSFGVSAEDAPVLALIARRDGSVWISVEDGGLFTLGAGSDRFVRSVLPDEMQRENVSVLYEDGSGTLWAGTQHGLVLRLSGEPRRVQAEPVGPRLAGGVVSLLLTEEGMLWAASEGGGVLRGSVSNRDFRIISREHGLLSTNVHYVMRDDEGNVWLAQSGGVSRLRVDHGAFLNYSSRSHTGERPVLPAGGVGAIWSGGEARDSCSIWAGTSEGGAVCIGHDGESEHLQEGNGLRSNWVNAVQRDRQGRVWLGTVNGINGISFEGGRLPVFGAERTVDVLGNRGRLRGYTNLTILSISRSDLRVDDAGSATTEALWFSGIRHLIGLVDDSWYVFSAAAGLPSSILNTATTDDEGRLWVGTRDRGLYRSVEPITAVDLKTWASDEIRLEGEFFGRLIVKPVFEQVWSADQGAPSNNIGPLLWMEDRLWVGTPQGLAVLDGESAAMSSLIGRDQGLRAENITSMAFSPVSRSLWVGTNQGLAEINPEDLTVVRTMTQEDGLIDSEVWMYGSVHVDVEGTVYYGTAKGIAVYRPDLDYPNPRPPRIRLRNATFSRSHDSHNEASFEYAALSFASEKAVRYRTRLRGYDREWSSEKTDTKIRYTNLPAILTARTYRLEVMARNNDGLWSDQPLSYEFRVAAPWWLRWWAFGLYLLMFGVTASAFVHQHRVRILRKEQEKVRTREMALTAEAALARSEAAEAQARALEAENQRKALELEKTRELRQAYHELQEAHAHLKKTQKQLVQQEKLASLGQLTAGIAHEIKNPLNFINNFALLSEELAAELAEAVTSGAEATEIAAIVNDLRLNSKKIHEHGSRADGIVRGMMDHARGGDGRRERVRLNELVDEYVSLAYHGMRTQLSDIPIEIGRHYSDDEPVVEASAQDLGRVLINLLTNALYAVHEHALRTNGRYAPFVRVETAAADGAAEIRVIDNGPGIPEHIRERIFEPFFTTKPAGSGTGLGLSLAYDIISSGHGGSLTVSSKVGEGTTFIIRLPLHVSDESSVDPPPLLS